MINEVVLKLKGKKFDSFSIEKMQEIWKNLGKVSRSLKKLDEAKRKSWEESKRIILD